MEKVERKPRPTRFLHDPAWVSLSPFQKISRRRAEDIFIKDYGRPSRFTPSASESNGKSGKPKARPPKIFYKNFGRSDQVIMKSQLIYRSLPYATSAMLRFVIDVA